KNQCIAVAGFFENRLPGCAIGRGAGKTVLRVLDKAPKTIDRRLHKFRTVGTGRRRGRWLNIGGRYTSRKVFPIGQKSFNRHEFKLICGNLHVPPHTAPAAASPGVNDMSCSLFWTSMLLLSIPEELGCVKQKSSARSGPRAINSRHSLA